MIDSKSRFFSEGQLYWGDHENPKTETHCNIWDWDELRMIKIKGTAKLFPLEKDAEIAIFAEFADHLSPDVRAVSVDDNGLLIGISTNPKEDDTMFIGHIPFAMAESLMDCLTIRYSQLQELDRLGPQVDLTSYKDESGAIRKAAFKTISWGKELRMELAWNEMHLLKSLPAHPNLVPFDRVVLEDQESRIIGFTTKFIPGGTLEDNRQLPFRFEWLQQLTQVVDYLNLELGIMHQDIAPRNLLVDPQSYKLLLFDFDWAACGDKRLETGRHDVIGVVITLYELITHDMHFSDIPHWDRSMDMVQEIANLEWPCNRKLNADVSTFRKYLNEWIASRKSSTDMERYLDAPNRFSWPDRPTPPDYEVPYESAKTVDGDIVWAKGCRLRRVALELGQYCFRWERPPQSRLKGEGQKMVG